MVLYGNDFWVGWIAVIYPIIGIGSCSAATDSCKIHRLSVARSRIGAEMHVQRLGNSDHHCIRHLVGARIFYCQNPADLIHTRSACSEMGTICVDIIKNNSVSGRVGRNKLPVPIAHMLTFVVRFNRLNRHVGFAVGTVSTGRGDVVAVQSKEQILSHIGIHTAINRLGRNHRNNACPIGKNVIHIILSLIHRHRIGISFKSECHQYVVHIRGEDKQRIVGHTQRLVHRHRHFRHREERHLHCIHLNITGTRHHHHILTRIDWRGIGNIVGIAGGTIDGVAIEHPLICGIRRGGRHRKCSVIARTQHHIRGSAGNVNHGLNINQQSVTRKARTTWGTDLHLQCHLLHLSSDIGERNCHAVKGSIRNKLCILSSLNNVP